MSTSAAPETWSNYLWGKVGFENIPQDIAGKSFYDLKVEMPGSKGKVLEMVSRHVVRDCDGIEGRKS